MQPEPGKCVPQISDFFSLKQLQHVILNMWFDLVGRNFVIVGLINEWIIVENETNSFAELLKYYQLLKYMDVD